MIPTAKQIEAKGNAQEPNHNGENMPNILERAREAILRNHEPDLILAMSDKIMRQETALKYARTYMETQPQNAATANILEVVSGVLESDEYVP